MLNYLAGGNNHERKNSKIRDRLNARIPRTGSNSDYRCDNAELYRYYRSQSSVPWILTTKCGLTQVRPPSFKEKTVTFLINMEKLSERVHEDDNFCVGCLRSRDDVPVTNALCYECGGGEEVLN